VLEICELTLAFTPSTFVPSSPGTAGTSKRSADKKPKSLTGAILNRSDLRDLFRMVVLYSFGPNENSSETAQENVHGCTMRRAKTKRILYFQMGPEHFKN
jgi:hypothetical protein